MEKIQLNQQKNADGSITYSYTYHPTAEKSFMKQEEEIAEITAAFGRAVTEQLLTQYDTKGEALVVQGERMTKKGSQKKTTSRLTAQSK
jgi:hypothetical protein